MTVPPCSPAALGLGEGDRIGVRLGNEAGRECLLTALGALRIGAAVVPFNTRASDEELAGLWRIATLGKLPGHGIDDPSFLQPSRPMSAIGG